MENEKNEKKKKEMKNPAFCSNEYSVWRFLVYVLIAFGGGQLIGGLIAYILKPILPIFREGGIFYESRESCTLMIAACIGCIFAILMMKPILHTTFRSLVTGNRKVKVGLAFQCMGIYAAIIIIFMIIDGKDIVYNPAAPALRIASIVFSLIFVPFQATFEEIIFRMSLGRLFMKNKILTGKSRILLASTVSGLLFFFPHLTNPEVRAYGIFTAILAYFVPGFSWMLISCLVGSFEAAIAIHTINNLWNAVVCTAEVSVLEFAPFFIDKSNGVITTCVEEVVLCVTLIAWAYYYRKKHKLVENDAVAAPVEG